jgi:hypothetical protein
VELQGGLAPTFDDWYELAPGGSVTWSETWYPAAKIGDVSYANDQAAVNVSRGAAGARVSVFPTRALKGQIQITLPGAGAVSRQVDIGPDRPYSEQFAGGGGPVKVVVLDAGGSTLVAYEAK